MATRIRPTTAITTTTPTMRGGVGRRLPSSPSTRAFLCTSAATETVPAAPATASAAAAAQRLGVRTTYAITPTAAATNAPRDEVRYMTEARIGSGNAARALATCERLEVMIASRSG